MIMVTLLMIVDAAHGTAHDYGDTAHACGDGVHEYADAAHDCGDPAHDSGDAAHDSGDVDNHHNKNDPSSITNTRTIVITIPT